MISKLRIATWGLASIFSSDFSGNTEARILYHIPSKRFFSSIQWFNSQIIQVKGIKDRHLKAIISLLFFEHEYPGNHTNILI